MNHRKTARTIQIKYIPTGCEIHHDCLTCPLPRCIEEMTYGERKRLHTAIQDNMLCRSIQDLMNHGMTKKDAISQTASRLGVKHRNNIYRKFKRYQGAKDPVPAL